MRSDEAVHQSLVPIDWPRVPGHEIVGDVVAIHPGETIFKVGDRVGIPFHGGFCGRCTTCMSGNHAGCDANMLHATGTGLADTTVIKNIEWLLFSLRMWP